MWRKEGLGLGDWAQGGQQGTGRPEAGAAAEAGSFKLSGSAEGRPGPGGFGPDLEG